MREDNLWVSVDLCLIPIGTDISLTPYITICLEKIKESGLSHELGPNGTAIEGNWKDVFDCIENCHQAVHSAGALRIYTTIKVNTRKDKKQSFKEKVQSVQSSLT